LANFNLNEFRGMSGQPAGGGALVPYQSNAQLVTTNLDVPGGPNKFDQLLQMLGNMPGGSKILRYAPGAYTALQQFPTDPLAGVATLGATAIAGKGLKALSNVVPGGPLAKGAVQLVGGLLAAPIAGQLGKGVSTIGNQLVGGTQTAVGSVASGLAGYQREQGQAAGSGREVGLGGQSQQELDRQTALLKQLGVNIPAEALAAQYQITQKYKDADVGRQMQMNQQLGQLTGALNRQMATYQLAGQAMGETGATTRQILGSNPYAASVLQTGGIRGI